MPDAADSAASRLCEWLGPGALTLVDGGASGGMAKRWRPIAASLKVIAFEPDERSDVGTSVPADNVVLVRKALAGRAGPRTLHLTRKPQTSSLYRPNTDVRRRFSDPGRADLVGERTVDCTTIDAAFAELNLVAPDFIKLDTQGTELEILTGAEQALTRCLGLEIEVEFLPLYQDAALFRDVDAYVSRYGFELYDLRRTCFMRPTPPPIDQVKGQLVYGDALYFRDWREVAGDADRLRRLAALLLVYGYADVVGEILDATTALSPADVGRLREASGRLTPTAVPATRKDTITGSGFQL